MRWPIRNQILLPFLAIGVLTVGAIAVTSSLIAVRNVESAIRKQVANVVTALEGASFPITPSVLAQLRSFSGAEFILVDEQRRPIVTTLGSLEVKAPVISEAHWRNLDRTVVGDGAPIALAGGQFFAGRVRWVDSRGGGHVLVLYPLADWKAARWEAMSPPLMVGGALLLVTIAISIVISRRLGRRIHRVQTQVARIANGDFHPIALSPIDDELRDLSGGVNRMAAALDKSLQQVRETERSALLTQLVGGLAHQLRNAITGARISVQLHQRRCLSREEASLDVALNQLRLTEEQLKALLRVTRGETRSPVQGDVTEILQQTVALVGPICEHHKITLQSDSQTPQWIIEDADAMRAALLNLVMNAIEAAGPGGRVAVDATVKLETLCLRVSDNGAGFTSDDDIFQTFFTTKPEGVGLGLSLARQAVEDCGGTLQARRMNGLTVLEILLHAPALENGIHTQEREAAESNEVRTGI